MAGEDNIVRAVFGAKEPPPPDDTRHGDGDDGGGQDFNLELARLARNDYGNAQRLIKRFGDELLFVRDVGWHAFNGQRWSREDGKDLATRFAHRTAVAMKRESAAMIDQGKIEGETQKDFEERIDKAFKWAVGSGNQNRIVAMLAQAQPYLPATVDDMDPDRYSFNVENGTLTLGDEVELRPHDRSDRITRLARVSYDAEAECPRFRAFLDEIMPDKELQNFLQRYFGYCLTGAAIEQCMLLMEGKGNNGKSTLIELLGWLFGDYALTLPIATLLHDEFRRGSEATPDIARLPGVRLAITSEPNKGARLDEGRVKHLTGGERMSARHLGKEFFDFDPQFKFVVALNNKFQVRGQDDGIWRRLKLAPFSVQVPADKIDMTLLDKLKGEAPGVLNWLLDGFRLWRESGLATPEAVRDAVKAYREDSDYVGQFLQTATAAAPGESVSAKALYGAYCLWCKQNAQDPMSQNGFGRQIVTHGYAREKIGVVFYRGLRILEDYQPGAKTETDGRDGAPPAGGEGDYGV